MQKLYLLQSNENYAALYLPTKAVVGNLFTTAGQKRVVIFVAGHIHNSSKGTHNIHP